MRHYQIRREAARRGEVRYYTGKLCQRGHDSERYTSNGMCVECLRERDREQARELAELRRQADAKEAAS